jgi:hypothetical protein
MGSGGVYAGTRARWAFELPECEAVTRPRSRQPRNERMIQRINTISSKRPHMGTFSFLLG